MDINGLPEESIQQLLSQGLETRPFFEMAQNLQNAHDEGRCAAVLVPLVRIDEAWHILLIRRSDYVADHKGQVAFPGGSCETDDENLEATALRETFEEIGIPPENIHLLGRLRELVTVSGFCVAPIVGVVKWPSEITLSTDEVSRVFTIPLQWLADPENRETRILNRLGRNVEVIYYRTYDDEILWGATARMVKNLLEVLENVKGQA